MRSFALHWDELVLFVNYVVKYFNECKKNNKESKILIMMYRHKTRFAEFIMCVVLILSVYSEVICLSCVYSSPLFLLRCKFHLFKWYIEAKPIGLLFSLLVVIVNRE